MNDTELCDLLSEARKIVLPDNCFDSLGQRLAVLLNWNDLPEIISAPAMDRETESGKTALYRTICGCDSEGITAPQLLEDLQTGPIINLGGWGGRGSGNGIYFTDDYSYSLTYAKTDDALTVMAVFNGKERIIEDRYLFFHAAPEFLLAHPKFAKMTNTRLLLIPLDLYAPLAVFMGYNVIAAKEYGRYNSFSVLNRGVLKICNQALPVKPPTGPTEGHRARLTLSPV